MLPNKGLVLVTLVTITICNAMHINEPDNKQSRQWALLVAGSSGWSNYRHQGYRLMDANELLLNVNLKELQPENLYEPDNILVKNKISNTGDYAINSIDKRVREKDEFDAFGEYIAASIRNLPEKQKQATVTFQIHKVLYEMMNQQDDGTLEQHPIESGERSYYSNIDATGTGKYKDEFTTETPFM